MTPLDVLAAAVAAVLAPASAADLLHAHRPDPGIDDDDEDEQPIGDPDDDDEGFDDDDDEDEDDEEPLRVSG